MASRFVILAIGIRHRSAATVHKRRERCTNSDSLLRTVAALLYTRDETDVLIVTLLLRTVAALLYTRDESDVLISDSLLRTVAALLFRIASLYRPRAFAELQLFGSDACGAR